MSLLYRTGAGRNNIAWGGGTSSAATYLRRISTGRNDISYISISTSGTYNILNRTSTGRNNIAWQNTTFSFKTQEEINADTFFGYLNNAANYFMFKAISDYFGRYGYYSNNIGGRYYEFIETGDPDRRSTATMFEAIGIVCKSIDARNTLMSQLNSFGQRKIATKLQFSTVNNTYYPDIYYNGYEISEIHINNIGIRFSHGPCSDSYYGDSYFNRAVRASIFKYT